MIKESSEEQKRKATVLGGGQVVKCPSVVCSTRNYPSTQIRWRLGGLGKRRAVWNPLAILTELTSRERKGVCNNVISKCLKQMPKLQIGKAEI